jgi:hypothetical protein
MSMNPARTFASAVAGRTWDALWVYFTAPPLGMLAAAQVYLAVYGRSAVYCAKLHHHNDRRCTFCTWRRGRDARANTSVTVKVEPRQVVVSRSDLRAAAARAGA